ncbi:MAG TPA: hypothetical protein VGG41_10495 [Solirubrobacteraceae bacterium]|jgi:hypothetical protein
MLGTVERESTPAPAPIEVDDGVIEEARRRQHRRRRYGIAALAVVALLAALLAPLFYGGNSAPPQPPSLRPASSLTPLAGPPLSGATHLTLVVSENGGAVSLVDVDRGTARAVHGLGLHAGQGPQVTLRAFGSAVLATTTNSNCQMWVTCAKGQASFPDRESQFLIAANGSARRVASFALARHQETTQAFRSTSTWVLNWPHRGACTLTLMPAATPAVHVPCGSPGQDNPAGLWIFNGDVAMRVNPVTGQLRQRLVSPNVLTPLHGAVALESAESATGPSDLSLVNLATGARRPVRWPSRFNFGYQVFPAPHGPLVALEFGEPWFPNTHGSVNQAVDLWVLNTATAALTHVPGFPALEFLKQSSIAWSADNRLIVAARGGGHTVVGVWKPGQTTLPIRTVPQLDGYSQFVALSR